MTNMSTLSPLSILLARAEARYTLYTAGELDLHDALASLFEYAYAAGIDQEIGTEGVLGIVGAAFPGENIQVMDAQ
jgi:hypothetical protein